MRVRSRTLLVVVAALAMIIATLPLASADAPPSPLEANDDIHLFEFDPAFPPDPSLNVDYDMVFPVVGPNHYSDTFGACRGSGCSRRHEGIDIMAAKMIPVVAVADGTIGWMHNEQGGNCCAMSLNHSDGWESYYIHLNNDTPGTDDGQGWGFAEGIVPGAFVTAGQLIGWVGDSGNAERTAPHLHYELHEPDGTVINPYNSLLNASVLTAPAVPVSARGCDFDDDGYHDLAIGSPGEDLGLNGVRTDSGAVTVLYGSFSGLTHQGAQNWHYNSGGVSGGLQADARFGAATACGDFDGDGYDDLAIGAPGKDRNSRQGTGAVTILYGTPGGLQAFSNNLFDMGSPGVLEVPDPGAGFGSVLASGDFNGDGYADVAVGAPDKARNGQAAAGIVVVLLGSANGIDGTSHLLYDGARRVGRQPRGRGWDSARRSLLRTSTTTVRTISPSGSPAETSGAHVGTGEVVIVPGGNNVFDKWRGRRLWAPSAGWVDQPGSAFGAALTDG